MIGSNVVSHFTSSEGLKYRNRHQFHQDFLISVFPCLQFIHRMGRVSLSCIQLHNKQLHYGSRNLTFLQEVENFL